LLKKRSRLQKTLFFIITSPVGPYFKAGFAPVKILAEDSYRRAWPGGTGNFKVPLELSERGTEAERGWQSTEGASERVREGDRERGGWRQGGRDREKKSKCLLPCLMSDLFVSGGKTDIGG